jgi:hypothetical protein
MGVIEVSTRKWRWKEVTLIAAVAASSSTRRVWSSASPDGKVDDCWLTSQSAVMPAPIASARGLPRVAPLAILKAPGMPAGRTHQTGP